VKQLIAHQQNKTANSAIEERGKKKEIREKKKAVKTKKAESFGFGNTKPRAKERKLKNAFNAC